MSISIFGRGGHKRPAGKHRRAQPGLPPRPRATRAAGGDGLRMMSLNVAHARRKARHQSLLKDSTIRRNLELIAGVLERERPQVVALQEADGPSFWSGGFDHLQYLATATGLRHMAHGIHGRLLPRISYGTGVLSRWPIPCHASLRWEGCPPA